MWNLIHVNDVYQIRITGIFVTSLSLAYLSFLCWEKGIKYSYDDLVLSLWLYLVNIKATSIKPKYANTHLKFLSQEKKLCIHHDNTGSQFRIPGGQVTSLCISILFGNCHQGPQGKKIGNSVQGHTIELPIFVGIWCLTKCVWKPSSQAERDICPWPPSSPWWKTASGRVCCTSGLCCTPWWTLNGTVLRSSGVDHG